MAVGNYYLILAEILKQQIGIAPVSPLLNLHSKVQLNSIGSEFESNNGIYTCIHPITNNLDVDYSVALMNIQSEKELTEHYRYVQEEDVKLLQAKKVPMFIRYIFIGWQDIKQVSLTLYLTEKIVQFDLNEIPIIMNNVFGDGVIRIVEIGELETRSSSKDILRSCIKNLTFEPLMGAGEDEILTATLQETPFLKRAFVTKNKTTMCIFKEHVLTHEPVQYTNEYAGTKFNLSKKIDQVMKENKEFDCLIVEATNVIDTDTGDIPVILTFYVNVNSINKDVVKNLLINLLNHFGIYNFDKIIPKKLTYFDVL